MSKQIEPDQASVDETVRLVPHLGTSADFIKNAVKAGYGAADTACRRDQRLHDPKRWEVLYRDMAYWEATLAMPSQNARIPRAVSMAERIAWAIGWAMRSDRN